MSGPSGIHLVAIVEFETVADIQQALTSGIGKRTAEDLNNFASAGVELLIFDSRPI